MLIDVTADESTASQVRSYAEYRFFTVLARHAPLIRTVHVVLRRPAGEKAADTVTCQVDVVLEESRNVHARVTRPHVYGAIDYAAARIGSLMDGRDSQPLSS